MAYLFWHPYLNKTNGATDTVIQRLPTLIVRLSKDKVNSTMGRGSW